MARLDSASSRGGSASASRRVGQQIMYWVYVLQSEKFAKSYVGYTDNVQRRLSEHNAGKSNFTSKYKPWKLKHIESFNLKGEAIKREKFLKSKSGRKFLKDVVFV